MCFDTTGVYGHYVLRFQGILDANGSRQQPGDGLVKAPLDYLVRCDRPKDGVPTVLASEAD
jgi:hypothetical protein